MKYAQRIVAFRLVRFLIVGAGNTTINFVVLNSMFYGLHTDKVLASVVATCCAILFSFALNRHYVFRETTQPMKKFALFSGVTALGTLCIQTSIYALCVSLLRQRGVNDFVALNLSMVIASCGVMLWNYNGYRLIVFNRGAHRNVQNNDSMRAA